MKLSNPRLRRRVQQAAVLSSMAIPSLFISTAYAQDSEANFELMYKIQQSLGRASPMTLIGPIVSNDVSLSEDGKNFSVSIDSPKLFGLVHLNSLNFDMAATSNSEEYTLSGFELPNEIVVDDRTRIEIGSSELNGLWSFDSKSYKNLTAHFDGVAVESDMLESSISIGAIDINIDSDAGSVIDITLEDVALPPLGEPLIHDTTLENMSLTLEAQGDQAIDIHAILSEVITQFALDNNTEAAYALLASLAKDEYDLLSASAEASGIVMTDYDSNAVDKNVIERQAKFGSVSLEANVDGVGTQAWDDLVIDVKLRDADTSGVDDSTWEALKTTAYASGSNATDIEKLNEIFRLASLDAQATIAHLPIQDVVQFVRWVSTGETKDGYYLEGKHLIGALFGHDNAELTVSGNGLNIADKDIVINLETFDTMHALKDFRQMSDATIMQSIQLDGLDVHPRLANDNPERQAAIKAISYLPSQVSLSNNISNLHIDLLNRLAENAYVHDGYNAAVAASPFLMYATSLEPNIQSEFDYQSTPLGIEYRADFQMIPLNLLSSLIYEGQIDMQIRGLEAITDDLYDSDEFIEAIGYQTLEGIATFVGILKAYGNDAGNAESDSKTYAISIEPDQNITRVTINDFPLYPSELSGLSMLGANPMMLMYMMSTLF